MTSVLEKNMSYSDLTSCYTDCYEKDLYRGTNRLVTTDGYQPNVSREAMTEIRASDRTDVPYGKPLFPQKSSGHVKSVPIRSFVLDAQRIAEQGKVDSALDLIYERADEMLLAGEFSPLNKIISDLSVDNLTIDVLLAVLTISLPAKSKLPARSSFYLSVKQKLLERGEFREGLLTGLQ